MSYVQLQSLPLLNRRLDGKSIGTGLLVYIVFQRCSVFRQQAAPPRKSVYGRACDKLSKLIPYWPFICKSERFFYIFLRYWNTGDHIYGTLIWFEFILFSHWRLVQILFCFASFFVVSHLILIDIHVKYREWQWLNWTITGLSISCFWKCCV